MRIPFFRPSLFLFLICLFPVIAMAIGEPSYISTEKQDGSFVISSDGKSTSFYADPNDLKGVIRALNDLKTDVGKVTGHEPNVVFDVVPNQRHLVVIGTIGQSAVIADLISRKKLNVDEIKGKWENFIIQTISNPYPGVDEALVIVGSDKRGTIYGIYDVAEQIGVSPWYYWADVPIEHKDALYFKSGRYSQKPSVQYRGIFINDEAPALTNWVKENFGTVKPSINPPIRSGVPNYNSEFYARIFELLLRLKANYLWPAMWENAFNEDDPNNPRLADEYGIVMGTSHQEPMVRSQQEWDRRYYGSLGHWDYKKYPDTMKKFWREGIKRNKNFENVVTLGLRGANDSEMEGGIKANIAMVEQIVASQQDILKQEYGADYDKIPQSWCFYKEIMEYYNQGMKVPDNITLLWSDDNWGNIRRLPNAKERERSGGAGVYYHFDYHGDPRSYEWINTNPIAKIWDQMTMAKQYGADKIWIVNVGHFKGYELPMEYFMDLAWDTERWTNDNINEYTRLFMQREFGSEHALEIANIVSKYTKFNGRRKPESLKPDLYSLVNYQEAERIVNEFNEITRQATELYNKLPSEQRDAFYQIVLFPTKASALVNELHVTMGKNKLYASQKRASTNTLFKTAHELFKADSLLMAEYNHTYANGRWNHFMDQTKIGYTSWNPPKKDSLAPYNLQQLKPKNGASLGVAIEGSKMSWPESKEEAVLPTFDNLSNKGHYIEIFNRGNQAFDFNVSTDVAWLILDKSSGQVNQTDQRIWFKIDESKLPKKPSAGFVKIKGAGEEVLIAVKTQGFDKRAMAKAKGFAESGGIIAIEAEHYSNNVSYGDRSWIKVDDYGLTLSGMKANAPANKVAAEPKKDAPCLTYPVHFLSTDSAEITLVTSPLLNVMPDRAIRIAVSFNDDEVQYLTVVPDHYKVHFSNNDWVETVLNQSRRLKTTLKIPANGNQLFKVWMVDPNVVVQKIIINTGGLRESYLGPQESQLKGM